MTPHDLLQHLDIIAEAPNGIARLRELVLQLAVRGKLVPQDPEDEPAALLLARRVKPVSPEEQEFDLPSGWAWSSIGLLGELRGGATPSKQNARFWGGSIPWVSPKDMKRDFIADSQDHVTTAAFAGSSDKTIPAGSLLMVVRGMILAHSFPTAVTTAEVTLNQDMKALLPFTTKVSPYLLLVTKGLKRQFLSRVERSSHGTCKLPTPSLIELALPVPPLPEQARIVARVDELMALLDRLEAARNTREATRRALRDSSLAALRDADTPEEIEASWHRVSTHFDALLTTPDDIPPFRQTILQLAVRGHLVRQDPTDEPASSLLGRMAARRTALVEEGGARRGAPLPALGPSDQSFTLPGGWVWCRVDDAFYVSGGIQKSSKRRPSRRSYPYLRVANVQRGRLDLTEIAHFELFDGELEQMRLAPGDLLVVEGNGSESEIGRCARWNGEIDACVHQNHLIRCRPLQAGIEGFVLLFLNAPAGMDTMKALAVTTSP